MNRRVLKASQSVLVCLLLSPSWRRLLCAQGVADVPIYGRVATLKLFRPPVRPSVRSIYVASHTVVLSRHKMCAGAQGADRDLLFLSTERYKFCVLGYDEVTGEYRYCWQTQLDACVLF